MRLTRVDVISSRGDVLPLFIGSSQNGFVVDDIDGLDPVQAEFSTATRPRINGSQHQSSRSGNRNLIYKISLEPDWATSNVGELRSRLRSFFTPKNEVSFVFYDDDTPFATIAGKTESFDAPRFVKEPQATISVVCFTPDFADVSDSTFPGDSNWETTLVYDGTASTGFELEFTLTGALSGFELVNNSEAEGLEMFEFYSPLVSGDRLTLSTIRGQKRIYLRRNGVDSSVLYGMVPTSTWPQLHEGVNAIRFQSTGVDVNYTIKYRKLYGGI